uniref:Uncharacterized protein n=1 Tax=Plectus sambesii TaxID=2011161 RepID=A0A914VXJ1_9BILA
MAVRSHGLLFCIASHLTELSSSDRFYIRWLLMAVFGNTRASTYLAAERSRLDDMKADLEGQVAALRRAKTKSRSSSIDQDDDDDCSRPEQPTISRKSTGVQTRIEMLKFSKKVCRRSLSRPPPYCNEVNAFRNGRATGNNDPFG